MPTIDDRIKTIDNKICRHLDDIDNSSRGAISQDILSDLKKLVEHIMLKFYSRGNDIEINTKNILNALEACQINAEMKILFHFYKYLEIVVEYYTLDEENSERLMLKYYRYMLEIKKLAMKNWGITLFRNLNKFPLHLDTALQEYYEKISHKIEQHTVRFSSNGSKYYIQKKKAFFVGENIYYEITFTPAVDQKHKSNRVIAFTKLPITSNYASKFDLKEEIVEVLGRKMPILIIVGWEVSIRGCEYKNFISLLNDEKVTPNFSEQKTICNFLTQTGYSLTEIIDFPDYSYQSLTNTWREMSDTSIFIDALDSCRKIIKNDRPGQNLLRYLLFTMNNAVIRSQKGDKPNFKLSYLYFQFGSIPFDKMPFIGFPLSHTPRLSVLYKCIPTYNRKHEILARLIRNNTEIKGHIFTPIEDIYGYDNIPELVRQYNSLLYEDHRKVSSLIIENGLIYINGYKDNTCYIIRELRSMATSGEPNYEEDMDKWLEHTYKVDCPEKKPVLRQMFAKSKVAIIYGSAGVGKSTLINHISHYFSEKDKLYLAQTNPAVENLKSRVDAPEENCRFSTITSYVEKSWANNYYDLLVVDECSTVDNENMVKVLKKSSYGLILLVGDTYQIDSIRFGNWFSAVKEFIPSSSVFELTKPYRTDDEYLLNLWAKVRRMDSDVQELIAVQSGALNVDDSLFSTSEMDEAILCLNYDGLYGINNINLFLQQSNPNQAFKWDIQQYKVGDPVLFLESNRFSPLIHNNMKGKIVGIQILDENTNDERISFQIELEKTIDEEELIWYDGLTIQGEENGKSTVQFCVYKIKNEDEDNNAVSRTSMPFQIAYSVSIHKSQGLEYDSVKLVITDEVDELITHSIFYTTITRARKKLKIYWTPEVENKIIPRIKPRDTDSDIDILRLYI